MSEIGQQEFFDETGNLFAEMTASTLAHYLAHALVGQKRERRSECLGERREGRRIGN